MKKLYAMLYQNTVQRNNTWIKNNDGVREVDILRRIIKKKEKKRETERERDKLKSKAESPKMVFNGF